MEALKHAAEQAKGGRGQIVAAMAEPGVGKSRLYFEFKATSQYGWMVLETFSISHGKASAYLPVLDLLHGYFKIAGEDDQRTRREKLTGRVLALDRSLEDTLPYLFSLLGIVEGDDPLAQMDGQIRKRRTLEAIKRILLRESLNQPLMVIFEDLHWIDEATQEFLNLLADSLGTAKLLLLVNYRPEYSHKWNSKTYYTQLRLDPLGKESADEMLTALLGDGKDLLPLRRLIIERTEGNPFFMEEIVQVLLDEGALVRDRAVLRLTKPLNAQKIPPTVQGILAARMDRLPADAKELLQTLAVTGREFPLSLIHAVVAKSDEELDRLLNELQLGEFIYEQPAIGGIEYVFKHALTQEVAYNSVLVERRRQLHERTAAALETLHASSIEEHLAELAHHYVRSANLDKALEYLTRAGQQALNRSAFAEAMGHTRAGLALIPELPAEPQRGHREFELLTMLVTAATALEGWDSAQTSEGRDRMVALARTSGDEVELATALIGAWADHLAAGRYEQSLEMAQQMLAEAQHRQNAGAFADAYTALGWTSVWMGKISKAQKAFDQAFALCPDGAGRTSLIGMDPMVELHLFACVSTCAAGYPDRHRRLVESAVQRARELNQPLSLSLSLFGGSWTTVLRGDFQTAERLAREGAELGRQGSYPHLLAGCNYSLGWALSLLAETERGIALIRDGIAGWTLPMTQYRHVMLAEAHLRASEYQEALEALKVWRELALNIGEHFGESEAERFEAEALLLMDPGNASTAERHLRHAIAIAAEQGAKWFELRATTSLARLLASQGRRDEARTMLAGISGWFIEGFDTADLVDAKALLEELQARPVLGE